MMSLLCDWEKDFFPGQGLYCLNAAKKSREGLYCQEHGAKVQDLCTDRYVQHKKLNLTYFS
jgi:hypothetical protein